MMEENAALQSASSRYFKKQTYKIKRDLVYMNSDVGSMENFPRLHQVVFRSLHNNW
jgi:hypothetical protein